MFLFCSIVVNKWLFIALKLLIVNKLSFMRKPLWTIDRTLYLWQLGYMLSMEIFLWILLCIYATCKFIITIHSWYIKHCIRVLNCQINIYNVSLKTFVNLQSVKFVHKENHCIYLLYLIPVFRIHVLSNFVAILIFLFKWN